MENIFSSKYWGFPIVSQEKLIACQINALINTDVGLMGFKDLHGVMLNVTAENLNLLNSKKFTHRQEVIGQSEYDLITNHEAVNLYHKHDHLAMTRGKIYVIEPAIYLGQETYVLGSKQGVYDDTGENIMGSFWQMIVMGTDAIMMFVNHLQQLSAPFSSKVLTRAEIYENTENTDIKLTEKEMECLFYTLRGKRAKEAAALMSITSKTVEFHLENLKNKFNCQSKSELISKTIELGFFEKVPASFLKTGLQIN